MSDILEGVLADLAVEGDQLESWVAPLGAHEWHLPTPSEGWDIAAQVAHLAWTDEAAIAAATDKEAWEGLVLRALDDPDGFVDKEALAGAREAPAAVLDRWRTARAALADVLRVFPVEERFAWFGPPMSATSMATARFMETWAHSLDVAEALHGAGLLTEVPAPTDRIRHVAHIGVRARDFAFANAGLDAPPEEFRVALAAPSGALWTWGPEDAAQSVRGPAYDFCLRVTQRRHIDDLDLVADGPDAQRWIEIAQAFAGPAGGGRGPVGGRP